MENIANVGIGHLKGRCRLVELSESPAFQWCMFQKTVKKAMVCAEPEGWDWSRVWGAAVGSWAPAEAGSSVRICHAVAPDRWDPKVGEKQHLYCKCVMWEECELKLKERVFCSVVCSHSAGEIWLDPSCQVAFWMEEVPGTSRFGVFS